MAKGKNSERAGKPLPSAVTSPLAPAVAATMPIVYSAQVAQMQTTSGPLPHPDLLRQYDSLHPGLAQRIVKMAEDEAAHRRQIEAAIIEVQARDQKAYRVSELLGQASSSGIPRTTLVR